MFCSNDSVRIAVSTCSSIPLEEWSPWEDAPNWERFTSTLSEKFLNRVVANINSKQSLHSLLFSQKAKVCITEVTSSLSSVAKFMAKHQDECLSHPDKTKLSI